MLSPGALLRVEPVALPSAATPGILCVEPQMRKSAPNATVAFFARSLTDFGFFKTVTMNHAASIMCSIVLTAPITEFEFACPYSTSYVFTCTPVSYVHRSPCRFNTVNIHM